MKFLLVLFALAFFASASTEFFNLPDLAFIPAGTYHVFDGAPNKNGKFDTIQGAIDQAVCDGYTKESKRIARVMIFQADQPYTGEGPDNEIHIPSSVRLHGVHPGTITGGPAISATIIMDNAGAPPPTSLGEVSNLIWQFSGLSFLQPSPDKPVIVYAQDLASFTYAPTFSDCLFFSEHLTATAPIINVSNFALLVVDRCWTITASAEPFILAGDACTVDYLNSVFVGSRAVVSTGLGAVIPGTSVYFKNMDFALELSFVGSPDNDLIILEQLDEGVANVLVVSSDFLLIGEIVGSTKDRIIYKAAPSVQNVTAFWTTNSYFWVPGGGANFLYDAPGATVNSGGNIYFPGTTSATNTNLVAAGEI